MAENESLHCQANPFKHSLNLTMYVDAGAVKDAIEKALVKRTETGRIQVVYLEAPGGSGKSTAIHSALKTYEGAVQWVSDAKLLSILESLKKYALVGEAPPDVVIVEDYDESAGQGPDVLKELAALPPEELLMGKKHTPTYVQWNPVIVYQVQRCCEHIPDSFVVQPMAAAPDPPPPYTTEE